jgi:hypothetical protein
MKPEDRLHRSQPYGPAPTSAADRPPLLLKHLGKGARVRLVCGACTWSRTYDPHRLIARLKEKGAGGEATAIAHVARHIQWPCPMCRRMGWVTQPDWAGADRPAAPSAGGGSRPA